MSRQSSRTCDGASCHAADLETSNAPLLFWGRLMRGTPASDGYQEFDLCPRCFVKAWDAVRKP